MIIILQKAIFALRQWMQDRGVTPLVSLVFNRAKLFFGWLASFLFPLDSELPEKSIGVLPLMLSDLAILGLDRTVGSVVTLNELQRAYRVQAVKVHPDKVHPDAGVNARAKFNLLTDAFDRLKRLFFEDVAPSGVGLRRAETEMAQQFNVFRAAMDAFIAEMNAGITALETAAEADREAAAAERAAAAEAREAQVAWVAKMQADLAADQAAAEADQAAAEADREVAEADREVAEADREVAEADREVAAADRAAQVAWVAKMQADRAADQAAAAADWAEIHKGIEEIKQRLEEHRTGLPALPKFYQPSSGANSRVKTLDDEERHSPSRNESHSL